jgi:hypothetical protein
MAIPLGPVIVALGGQLAVRPLDGETILVSVTVPVNPPEGMIVIVQPPVEPVLKLTGPAAEIVKSEVTETEVTVAVNLIDLDAPLFPDHPMTVML